MRAILKHFYLLSFAVFFFATTAKAGILPFTERIYTPYLGAPVITGTSTALKTVTVNPLTGSFYDHKVTDRITFGVDQSYQGFEGTEMDVVINVHVKRWDQNLVVNAMDTDIVLTIQYHPFTSSSYLDHMSATFKKWYKMEFKVTSITVNGVSTTTLPAHLYVDGHIFVERYENFSGAAIAMNPSSPTEIDQDCDGKNDALRVAWTNTPGAEEYQFEWIYINDYDLTDVDIDYNFKYNSTRVSTPDNHYDISLIYDQGWLVYRVRGIGVNTSNVTQQIVGNWSAIAESGTVASVASSNKYQILSVDAHEAHLNWEYSVSYAEQGKKKEVVSYYDGSLRNRQSVTKSNSDENAIVGETIYDHQGRPAINVLPVPVKDPTCSNPDKESSIRFYPKFNVNAAGEAYSSADFDVPGDDICDTEAAGMKNTSGASNYYSSQNPDQAREQSFVPDAQLYPFSQVEYTPDNTGRISRQGDVGPEFQIKSGNDHETRYLYGQPVQEELDRLFASEVGDADHYKKNVVIDAHGQATVTYFDMEGNVIATALAGDNPGNMLGLPSEQAIPSLLPVNAFGYQSNKNDLNEAGDQRTLSTQLTVAAASEYTFDYGLVITPLSDECLEGVCVDCVYDLTLSLIDECGENLFSSQGYDHKLTGRFEGNEESGYTFHPVCNDDSPDPIEPTINQIVLTLQPGSYSLNKILTVNAEARQAYIDLYFDETVNDCVKTFEDFHLEALADIDITGCDVTCEECIEELGTLEAFIASGQGSASDYYLRKEDCDKLCAGGYISFCEAAYIMLKNDVSPGGQYAEHTNTSNVFNPDAFELSVLSSNNQLPKNIDGSGTPVQTAYWRLPHFIDENGVAHDEYREENGERSRVVVTYDGVNYTPQVLDPLAVFTDPDNGSLYIYPENLLDVEVFAGIFKPSWAQSLVSYHPEYCYYEACLEYNRPKVDGDAYTSQSFDDLLMASQTIQSAKDNGFLKEVVPGTHVVNDWFTPSLGINTNDDPAWDPFVYYHTSYVTTDCGDFGLALQDKFNVYQTINGIDYSMIEIAAVSARYGIFTGQSLPSSYFDFGSPATPEIQELEWQNLQSFYRSAKQELQQARANCIAIKECQAYNGCIGDDAYSPISEGMVNLDFASFFSSPYFDQQQPCGAAHRYLYAYKVRRFADKSDSPIQDANQAAYHVYLQTGQCPVTFALQTLLNRLAVDENLDNGSLYLTPMAEFTSVFFAQNNFYMPSVIPDLTWQASTAGTTLTADWVDGSSAVYGTITLSLPVSSSLVWDDLIGIMNFTATTPGTFTAQGTYMDGSDVAIVELTGTVSMFNIQQCVFEQDCSSNKLAGDLSVLLNAMAVNGDLLSAPVPIYTAPYDALITDVISGPTYPYDQWEYIAPNQFHLYNSYGTVTDGLYITLNSAVPSTFTWSQLSTITAFENLVSTELNTFSLVAHVGAGNVTLYGDVVRVVDGIPYGLPLGECQLPTPIHCTTPNHEAFEQLEDLLYDVLINQPFTGTGINIFESAEMSPAISSFFDNSATSSTSTYTHDYNGSEHTGTLNIQLTDCSITLWHSDESSPVLNLSELISISNFSVDGDPDDDGNYTEFTFVGTFDQGGTTYTTTVHGKSCIPLKACVSCPEDPITDPEEELEERVTSLSDKPSKSDGKAPMLKAEEGNPCESAYAQYLTCIEDYNRWADRAGQLQITDILTYEDFVAEGYCNCVDEFCAVLTDLTKAKEFPKESEFMLLVSLENICDNGGCQETFQQYLDCYEAYQDWTKEEGKGYPISFLYKYDDFVKDGLCFCVDEFCARLNAVMTGIVEIHNQSELDQYLDFRKFCVSRPPCTPEPTTGLPVVTPTVTPSDNCVEMAENQAWFIAHENYQDYIDETMQTLIERYNSHCMGSGVQESFNYTYNDKMYHFMLYYYDQAGNIIKTVPPEGVEKIDLSIYGADIANDRANGTRTVFTTHRLASRYEYNSLNQVIAQYVPDQDPMEVFEMTLSNGLHAKLQTTQIQMVTPSKGYLSGYIGSQGYLYRTDDGGATWILVSNVVGSDLKKVQMLSASIGFAIGNDGTVLQTIDGGATWNLLNTWTTTGDGMIKDLNDLWFVSTGASTYTGIIVGENKAAIKVLVSSGSATFTAITPSAGSATASITSVTSDGTNFLITMNDLSGGLTVGRVYQTPVTTPLTWTEHTAYNTETLYDVDFYETSGSKAYASGKDGRLYKNTNAISNTNRWVLVPTNVTYPIRAIRFFNETQGMALMETAAGVKSLMRTVDGGQTWTQVSAGNFNNLTKVKGGMIMAVGKAGLIEVAVASADPTIENIVIHPINNTVEFTAGWAETESTPTSVIRILVADVSNNVYYTDNGFDMTPAWNATSVSTGGSNIVQIAAKRLTGSNYLAGVVRTASNQLYGIGKASSTSTISVGTMTGVSGSEFKAMALDDAGNRVFTHNNTTFKVSYVNLTAAVPTACLATSTAVTGSAKFTAMAYTTNQVIGLHETAFNLNAVSLSGTTYVTDYVQSTFTSPGALYDIEYTATGTVYVIAGADGQYYRKTTSGTATTWQRINTGFNASVKKVKTATGGVYLAGTAGLFRKGTLSGNTMTTTLPMLTTGISVEQGLAGASLNDIDFRGTRMYAVGDDGNVLYTADYTTTAFTRTLQGNTDFFGVAFKTSANQAYAVGTNARMHELSAASFILKKELFVPIINDVHFSDANTGTLIANNYTIRKTLDGGMTWQVIKPNALVAPLGETHNKVWTVDGQYSLVFGNNNQYKVTGGLITSAGISGLGIVAAVAKGNGNTLYVGSNNAVKKITLSGVSPSFTFSTTNLQTVTSAVYAIHVFANDDYAFAGLGTTLVDGAFKYCYANNTVAFSQTFTKTIRDMHFHDRINGVLVGDAGTYYKTTGQSVLGSGYLSGATWTSVAVVGSGTPDPYQIATPAQMNIRAIAFTDASHGIFGGIYTTALSNIHANVRLVYTLLDRYTSRFYYDKLGRLVISQNSRQYHNNIDADPEREPLFSYILYDDLGRVKEAGEKLENALPAVQFASIFGADVSGYANPKAIADQALENWLNVSPATTRREVTKTFYDKTVITGLPVDFIVDVSTQRYRITHVTYQDVYTLSDQTYDHATHYNYDIHGNVKNLLQDNQKMATAYPTLASQRYKQIDYTYDLISGNVHRISVENGDRDQWHHAYSYDADNRITDVYTSLETPLLPATASPASLEDEVLSNQNWENDAHYIYYDHGPLARVELGEHQLQGMDYIYNVQGWIKGVNSTTLNENKDPGNDNRPSTPNFPFAKDVIGYSLHYFDGDYAAINSAKNGSGSYAADIAGSDLDHYSSNLYDGNVRAMQTTITNPTTYAVLPLGNAYQYDQMSRLRESRSFTSVNLGANDWANWSTYNNMYYNEFTYDANGNIQTQKRYDGANAMIDNLTYRYDLDASGTKVERNRLYHVNDDPLLTSAYSDDIDDQDPAFVHATLANANYTYDKEGRLIKDKQEKIDEIVWRRDGKIKEITKSGTNGKRMKFDYDALGNRIAKHVHNYSTGVLEKSTYYILDPNGNVVNTYEHTIVSSTSNYNLVERQMYGRSRLGMSRSGANMLAGTYAPSTLRHYQGNKFFEMSNHLGNVLAVVMDKVTPMDSNHDGAVDGHQVWIVQSTDYSPFGVTLRGRNFVTTSADYRYGFQGQEEDDEIKGEGNSVNYTYRMHDPRLGRFFAIDPLTAEYPWYTPYSFSGNKVVNAIEFEGLEEVYVYSEWKDKNGTHRVFKYKYRDENLKVNVNQINIYYGTKVPGDVKYIQVGTKSSITFEIKDANDPHLKSNKEVREFFNPKKSTPAKKAPTQYSKENSTPWVDKAKSQKGVKEATGNNDGPEVENYNKTCGIARNEMWCGSFVYWCFKQAGIEPKEDGVTNPGYSLDWRNFGNDLNAPALGAIATKKRDGGGHVGIVVGITPNGDIIVLGGNQSNAVTETAYSPEILQFNYPSGYTPNYNLGTPREVSNAPVTEQ